MQLQRSEIPDNICENNYSVPLITQSHKGSMLMLKFSIFQFFPIQLIVTREKAEAHEYKWDSIFRKIT